MGFDWSVKASFVFGSGRSPVTWPSKELDFVGASSDGKSQGLQAVNVRH